GSDDEVRVAATSCGIAVTMALHDLSVVAMSLRADIRRGRFDDVAEHLKIIHDGVRGLRTELDLRNDSAWGKQLAALRADISNAPPRRWCSRCALRNRAPAPSGIPRSRPRSASATCCSAPTTPR